MRFTRRDLLGTALALGGVGVIGHTLHEGNEPAPLPEQTFHVANPVPAGKVSADIPEDRVPGDVAAGPSRRGRKLVGPDQLRRNQLLIPAIEVLAPIEHVSFRSSGNLTLPGADSVGFATSSAPLHSAQGTTLLAGHVASGGHDGALKWLARLAPGDWVFLADEFGRRSSFLVSRNEVFVKEDIPAELRDTTTGPRRITLVTCGGPITRRADGRHWRDNVVVHAIPAPWPRGGR